MVLTYPHGWRDIPVGAVAEHSLLVGAPVAEVDDVVELVKGKVSVFGGIVRHQRLVRGAQAHVRHKVLGHAPEEFHSRECMGKITDREGKNISLGGVMMSAIIRSFSKKNVS